MNREHLFFFASSFSLLLASAPARAQESPPAEATTEPPAPPPEPAREGESPKPEDEHGHPGFELDLSLGYAVAAGNATGAPNDDMGNSFSGQVPFGFQAGGNVIPSLFLGGYAAFAPGGAGGTIADTCNSRNLSCNSLGTHAGFVVEYRFQPGESIQPWLGYGFGYEWNTLKLTTQNGAELSETATGWEFGHFRGGIDFLAHPAFAFGLFADVGVGQYDHLHQEGGTNPYDGDVPNKALHEWISFGVRSRFMP